MRHAAVSQRPRHRSRIVNWDGRNGSGTAGVVAVCCPRLEPTGVAKLGMVMHQ